MIHSIDGPVYPALPPFRFANEIGAITELAAYDEIGACEAVEGQIAWNDASGNEVGANFFKKLSKKLKKGAKKLGKNFKKIGGLLGKGQKMGFETPGIINDARQWADDSGLASMIPGYEQVRGLWDQASGLFGQRRGVPRGESQPLLLPSELDRQASQQSQSNFFGNAFDQLRQLSTPTETTPATPRWIIPAAVGGGVLVLVLALRKK